jgi:septal ring factor EnvC (AmiA/AmiB activator)
VERLIEEAQKEGTGLDGQIAELDEKHEKLEKALEQLSAEQEESEE